MTANTRTTTTFATGQVIDLEEATQITPHDIAVGRIVAEIDCTAQEAIDAIAWLNRYVEAARNDGYEWQYPCTEDMRGHEYAIIDAAMQHGAVAEVGSAHEALENALLDRSRGEMTLMHDNRDEMGSPAYCSFQVAINVMRV